MQVMIRTRDSTRVFPFISRRKTIEVKRLGIFLTKRRCLSLIDNCHRAGRECILISEQSKLRRGGEREREENRAWTNKRNTRCISTSPSTETRRQKSLSRAENVQRTRSTGKFLIVIDETQIEMTSDRYVERESCVYRCILPQRLSTTFLCNVITLYDRIIDEICSSFLYSSSDR